jgi:acetolactate synthase I/II/III large subunit
VTDTDFDLDDEPGHPDIDWVGLAKSLGVPGARVADMNSFNRRFAEGLATPGPYLVEVVL